MTLLHYFNFLQKNRASLSCNKFFQICMLCARESKWRMSFSHHVRGSVWVMLLQSCWPLSTVVTHAKKSGCTQPFQHLLSGCVSLFTFVTPEIQNCFYLTCNYLHQITQDRSLVLQLLYKWVWMLLSHNLQVKIIISRIEVFSFILWSIKMLCFLSIL